MRKEELAPLLEHSTTANKKPCITGLLAYIEGKGQEQTEARFMHVLEGEKSDVQYVFNNMLHDPRHYDIVLHKQGQLSERRFNNWSIAFEQIILSENPDLSLFFNLNETILQSDAFKHSDAAMDFLMAF